MKIQNELMTVNDSDIQRVALAIANYRSDSTNTGYRDHLVECVNELYPVLLDDAKQKNYWYYSSNSLKLATLLTSIGINIPIIPPDVISGESTKDVFEELTILIPNYNHSRWLRTCLDSIIGQSVLPCRVVVLDDCSTDNSFEILKEYASKFSWIDVHRNDSNLGTLRTLAALAKLATTKYIYFGAADDFILLNFVKYFRDATRLHSDLGIYFGYFVAIDEAGRLLWTEKPSSLTSARSFTPDTFYSDYLLRESFNFSLSGATIYHRDAYLSQNGYVPSLSGWADTYILRNIALKYGAYYINAPCIAWRIHAVGESFAAQSGRNIEESIEFVSSGLKAMSEERDHAFYSDSYKTLWASQFLTTYFLKSLQIKKTEREMSFVDRLGMFYEYAKAIEVSGINSYVDKHLVNKIFINVVDGISA